MQMIPFLSLVPHPSTPPVAIGAVTCSINWAGAGNWLLTYRINEPPEALRLPQPTESARADGLWQRTCFELFLRREGKAEYFEFNFSPSGEWAAYQFDDYRAGMTALGVTAPTITSTDPAQFALGMAAHLIALGIDAETAKNMAEFNSGHPRQGSISQYALFAQLDDSAWGEAGQWLVAISAVIEESDGTKSYWALRHPPGKPDFHHPDCFALELPAPLAP